MTSSSNSNQIVLIDCTDTSLTISWPSVSNAQRYILQYRSVLGGDTSGEQEDSYTTLSDKLTTTQAKKNNLHYKDGPFLFRVKPVSEENSLDSDWMTHDAPFQVYTTEEMNNYCSNPPDVETEGATVAHVQWTTVDHEHLQGYELQMRPTLGGEPWHTIAPCIKNTQVRKRNLTSGSTYQFRVRPVLDLDSPIQGDVRIPFSPPSQPVTMPTLSHGMKRLFAQLDHDNLLQSSNGTITPISCSEALAGKKLVLLYASAHWCPPCRKFTPQLAQFYQQANKAFPNAVEIVFLSCDHDERQFTEYYKSMPWKAVPYESDVRERLLAWIRVTGIPRLVVLNGATGAIVEDNVVGKPLDLTNWLAKC